VTLNISLSGVVYQARVLLCTYQETKFEVPSFTDFKDLLGAKLKKKTSKVTLPRPLGGSLSDVFHLHTKFGGSRFRSSAVPEMIMIASIKI